MRWCRYYTVLGGHLYFLEPLFKKLNYSFSKSNNGAVLPSGQIIAASVYHNISLFILLTFLESWVWQKHCHGCDLTSLTHLCAMRDGRNLKGTDIMGLARDWTESPCLCVSDLTNWIDLLSGPTMWLSFSVVIVLSHSPHLAALSCPQHGSVLALAPAS